MTESEKDGEHSVLPIWYKPHEWDITNRARYLLQILGWMLVYPTGILCLWVLSTTYAIFTGGDLPASTPALVVDTLSNLPWIIQALFMPVVLVLTAFVVPLVISLIVGLPAKTVDTSLTAHVERLNLAFLILGYAFLTVLLQVSLFTGRATDLILLLQVAILGTLLLSLAYRVADYMSNLSDAVVSKLTGSTGE